MMKGALLRSRGSVVDRGHNKCQSPDGEINLVDVRKSKEANVASPVESRGDEEETGRRHYAVLCKAY